jgi:type IV secretory pathway protease TraF
VILKVLRVSENSLSPVYLEGDYVLVSIVPLLFGAPKRGDIIVFRHEVYGTMIKMVEAVAPGGEEFSVVGTRAESVDSRRFGPISRKDVAGKVIWHIKGPRPERAS